MKKLFSLFLLVSVSALAGDTFKTIDAATLNQMIESHDQTLAVYDVNTPDTRKNDGMIPTAKPLSSSKSFADSELPPSKDTAKLVFYCMNTQCMASHAAAQAALKKGYHNVMVMKDGIMGWKTAGYKTTLPSKQGT